MRVWSYPIWAEIRQRPELFERSAAWSFTQFNLAAGGETQFVDGLSASGSFLETLRIQPSLGRVFSETDDVRGAEPVAVISHGFWQRRFGGVIDIIGRSLRFDDVPFTMARSKSSGRCDARAHSCGGPGGVVAFAPRSVNRSG